MSSDIKNDLINWNAEQLSDDSPVYNSKDLINALNSVMPSLGSVILTTNNHVLSKQEDWDSITMNTLNMFTTLANSGLPANDFPNNSGVLLVLGYTSYNIYIAISGEAVYYRLGGDDWNKLLTSETIKDLTGSVATLMDTISKLSDQQTTLSSLFNTFKDGTNKQLDILNTESTSQAKMLEDINNRLLALTGTVDNAGLISAPAFQSLQTQVNNSAVGTNLVKGSEQEFAGKSYEFHDYHLAGITELTPGETYTMSFSSRVDDKAVKFQQKVLLDISNPSWGYEKRNYVPVSTDYQRVTYTFTIPEDQTGVANISVYLTHPVINGKEDSTSDKSDVAGTGYIKEFKLEKGSVATDWCPNPEDNFNISANTYPFKAIMSSFTGQNSESLDLYWTDDYIYFHPINKSIPNGIPKESMRDPSIAYFDNKFWIACTWAIYYSYDLINFTRIDIPSAISTPSYWSWAPEWFIDTDGTPYLFATSGNSSTTYDDKANMQIYWCKFNPLDKSVGPWTLVKYNQPTGIKNNIDPCVAYFKGSYYLAMKLEYGIGTSHWEPYIQLYKSDSIDGNYTYIMDLPFQTANGNKNIPVEGPSLVVDNDTMYCYADGFTNRSSYRLETKDGTTWENMISISALDGSRTQHFTVLPLSSSEETSIIQKAVLYYSPTILGSSPAKLRMSVPTQPIYSGVNDIYPQSGIENYYSLKYPKVGDTVEVIIHMDKNGYASKIHFINDNDNPNVTLKIVANDAFKAPNNSSAYITKITHSPVTLTSKGSYGGESPIADPYEVSSAIIDFLGGRNYAYNTEVSNQVVGNKTVGQAIGEFPLDPICLNYFKNKSSVRVSFDIDVNNADGAELFFAFTSKWMPCYCGTLDNSGTFHMSFSMTLSRDITSTDTLGFTLDNSTATVKIYNVMLESGTIEHSYVPAIAPRITQDNGEFLLQLTTANNSDLSSSIYNFSSGFATFYCQSGVANNPSNNSCQGFFHKSGGHGEGLLVDSDGISWSIAITGESSVTYTKLSSDSDVPQAIVKPALASGIDLNTVVAPGVYPFSAISFTNYIDNGTYWGYLVVTSEGNIVTQLLQVTGHVMPSYRMASGSPASWSPWARMADDILVAHLSGANNFDTVPTYGTNNKPFAINDTGATPSRPTGQAVGYQYFDTTLNKPIWYTGSNWVDATGATV